MKYLTYLFNIDYIKLIFRLSDIGYLNPIVVGFLYAVIFGILWGCYVLFRSYIYFLVNHSILSNFLVNVLYIKYKYIILIIKTIVFICITILLLAVLFIFLLLIMSIVVRIQLLTGNVLYCADALMADGLPSLLGNSNYYDFYGNYSHQELRSALTAIRTRQNRYLLILERDFLSKTNIPCYSIFDLRYEYFNQRGQEADLELFNNYITELVRSEWQRCRILEMLNQNSFNSRVTEFIRQYIIRSNIKIDYTDIIITN